MGENMAEIVNNFTTSFFRLHFSFLTLIVVVFCLITIPIITVIIVIITVTTVHIFLGMWGYSENSNIVLNILLSYKEVAAVL